MRTNVLITLKPNIDPVGPAKMREMVPYYVDSVRGNCPEVSVGDVLLKFPIKTGGHYIFNCTQHTKLKMQDVIRQLCC